MSTFPRLMFSFSPGIVAGLFTKTLSLKYTHKKSRKGLDRIILVANRCHSSERRHEQEIPFEVQRVFLMWLHLVYVFQIQVQTRHFGCNEHVLIMLINLYL